MSQSAANVIDLVKNGTKNFAHIPFVNNRLTYLYSLYSY